MKDLFNPDKQQNHFVSIKKEAYLFDVQRPAISIAKNCLSEKEL